MRTEFFLCISVLRVVSGPRVQFAGRKSDLTPPPAPRPRQPGGLFYCSKAGDSLGVSLTLSCFVVYSTRRFVVCLSVCHFVFFSPFSIAITSVVCSTDRSKAVVPVLVLLFVALWFILRGDLLYVFPYVILFLCFSVLLVLRLRRLGKRELILVLFVRLFGLCLFRFVGFLFLLGSGKGCSLWLWHSLDFSLTFFCYSTRRFTWSLALYYFVLVFLSPFIIAIFSLGEERNIFGAFRVFVRFALVWFCLFPLPLGVWEKLRLVIV